MDGIEVLAVDTGGTILDWQSGIVRVLAGTGAPRAVEHDWCTRGAEDRERSRYPGLLHPHCGHALRNKLIELTRWRAAFATGHPAQQSSIGRLRASCRQLEARDAHVAPTYHGTCRTQAGIQPRFRASVPLVRSCHDLTAVDAPCTLQH